MKTKFCLLLAFVISCSKLSAAAAFFGEGQDDSFSEFIATSINSNFQHYIKENNLDPSPPTTTSIEIGTGEPARMDVTVSNLRISGIQNSTVFAFNAPTCLDENTFTVNYCIFPWRNETGEVILSVTGNYIANGTNKDGSPIYGDSQLVLYSAGIPILCQTVEYFNFTIEETGNIDFTDASSTAEWEWYTNPFTGKFPTAFNITGLEAKEEYRKMVTELIWFQYRELVGERSLGNPLFELIDSFIRRLLESPDFYARFKNFNANRNTSETKDLDEYLEKVRAFVQDNVMVNRPSKSCSSSETK